MTDNPTLTRPQDARRVNIDRDHELRYWCEKLEASPDRLREAVQQVGPMVEDVADFLAAETRSQ